MRPALKQRQTDDTKQSSGFRIRGQYVSQPGSGREPHPNVACLQVRSVYDYSAQEPTGLARWLVRREACVNAARHADATVLYVDVEQYEDHVDLRVMNDGKQPDTDIVPGGGLEDLRRMLAAVGGKMEISHGLPLS